MLIRSTHNRYADPRGYLSRALLRPMYAGVLAAFAVVPGASAAAQTQPAAVVGQAGAPDAEGVSIAIDSGRIDLLRDGKKVVTIEAIRLDFHRPDRIDLVETPGGKALRLSFDGLDDFYRNAALGDRSGSGREALLHLEVGPSSWRLVSREEKPWFSDVEIDLVDDGSAYYGLTEVLAPDNALPMDLAGKTIVLDYVGEAHRYLANYASASSPFFYSTAGYASFFDSRSEGQYQFGVNGLTRIRHRAYGFDWHVLYGPTLPVIQKQYFKLVGTPKKVPDWALGPIIWRDENRGGAAEIVSDVDAFTRARIPLTAIFVDRPYSNGAEGWSKMDFGPKFADPQSWVSKLRTTYDMRFMTWIAPMVFADLDFPGRLPGAMGYFDLTNPTAVTEFERRLEMQQHRFGVQGHKMDRADEDFPVAERWMRSIPPELRRGEFIALYAKSVDRSLRAAHGDDQFNFARAAVHGTQPFLSAIWGGDVRSNWGGLATNVANAQRAGYLGFPNWGSDIGGYQGDTGRIPEELYLRWTQFGVWTGFFGLKLDGAGGYGEDRLPWRYSSEFQRRYREAFTLRTRLIPYLRSQLNRAEEIGVLMRPMAGAYPNDPRTHAIWDQYLFGDDFLVAPVVSPGASTREVFLPAGSWFDFFTDVALSGDRSVKVQLSADRIPVFVRDGAVIVLGAPRIGNSRAWTGPDAQGLDIRVYLDRVTEGGTMYVDEGVIKPIAVAAQAGTVQVTAPALTQGGTVTVITPAGTRRFRFAPNQPIAILAKLGRR